jgi:hypothetical protein
MAIFVKQNVNTQVIDIHTQLKHRRESTDIFYSPLWWIDYSLLTECISSIPILFFLPNMEMEKVQKKNYFVRNVVYLSAKSQMP